MPQIAHVPSALSGPGAAERVTECLIDGLKIAVDQPGEHRLFRWGKLPGLFASRAGTAGAAATRAIAEHLLDITRTEVRGKLVVEWVRASPAAVEFLHEHDSPKAVLRELRQVLQATRTAIPEWMEQARDEAAQLALRFEHRAAALLERLDKIARSVEAAIRRTETASRPLGPGPGRVVPWADTALHYLDRRAESSASRCTLAELFRAVSKVHPELSLGDFQNGLRRLEDMRSLTLVPAQPHEIQEPEFTFLIGRDLIWFVERA